MPLAVPRLQAPKQHLQICEAASLQFIKGVNESTVPDVSLRRSRTGTAGQAMFTFENPSIFQASSELGDITGATERHKPQTDKISYSLKSMCRQSDRVTAVGTGTASYAVLGRPLWRRPLVGEGHASRHLPTIHLTSRIPPPLHLLGPQVCS